MGFPEHQVSEGLSIASGSLIELAIVWKSVFVRR
jgi:hypothetical protein